MSNRVNSLATMAGSGKTLHVALTLLAFQFVILAHSKGSYRQVQGTQASPHGVVVESVDGNSEAEKNGIKPGDMIDGWTRSAEHGTIENPFDFDWVEIEQKPRGPLTLEGRSSGQKKTWNFVTDQLGVKVRPSLSERPAEAYAQSNAAALKGNFAEAAQLLSTAAGGLTADDPPWLASWLMARAADYAAKDPKSHDAETYYQQAIQHCPDANRVAKVMLLDKWAHQMLQTSATEKAEQLYRSGLKEIENSPAHTLLEAQGIEGIGLAASLHNESDKAREYLSQSLQIRELLAPESSAVASSLLWLGSVDLFQGNLSSAQRFIEHAVAIDSRLAPLSPEMAEGWNGLGMLAHNRGDLARAEEYTRHVLSIGEHLGRPKAGTAAMLVNLGAIAQENGDYVAAERYLNESITMIETVDPGHPVAGAALNNLGSVLTDEGKFDAAESRLQQALAIKKKANPNGIRVASTLGELGRLAFERGQPQAASYLQQALEIQQRNAPISIAVANTLAALGSVAMKANDAAKAEEYYGKVASIREQLAPKSAQYGEALSALADIRLRQNKRDEAVDLYAKAINVFEDQRSRLGGAEARSVFQVKHERSYREYLGLLVEQGKPELAFEVLERSRARALLEMLDTAHAKIRKGVDEALLARQQSLELDINAKSARRTELFRANQGGGVALANVDQEINDLVKQYDELQNRIRTSSPEYAALMQPQTLSSPAVRKDLLDRDTVLLAYSLGEKQSYLFAVTSDSTKAFTLPARNKIETAALSLYKLLSAPPSPQPNDLLQAAATLSEMVLRPAAAQLGNKRIVVVADGALHYIPFAMLPDPAIENVPSHEPLIVGHAVSNLPSASVLATLRRQAQGRARPRNDVAIFADPVFQKDDPRVTAEIAAAKIATEPILAHAAPVSKKQSAEPDQMAATDQPSADRLSADLLTRSAGDLGLERNGKAALRRLLYSRREAEAIRAMMPPGRTMTELDFNANRSAAISPKLSQYRIVHFATHGLINAEHPELSGLVFSLVARNGQPENGFLRLEDIYNLNLPADLVVLSACETGLGKEINGEGLIGLTRGFMYAGATRVVASLWNVSDVATAELMSTFYRAMEKDGLPPAAALRSAQIALWKQHRWNSPYFWAAFQIQGEWK